MSDDLISRSALKEAIRKRLGISSLKYLTEQEKAIVEEIDNAPTVNTTFREVVAYECGQKSVERPQGEWLEDSGNIACSHCHTIWLYRRTDYCPHCGAKMQKGEG